MRIIAIVENVNMCKSHTGLSTLLSELGINLKMLPEDVGVAFLNKKRTKVKILTSKGNVFSYLTAKEALGPGCFADCINPFRNGVTFESKARSVFTSKTKEEINYLSYKNSKKWKSSITNTDGILERN